MTDKRSKDFENTSLPPAERARLWLASEGYPLEFQVADTFRRHGFAVQQGTHERQDEGQPLEIDAVATLEGNSFGDTRIALELIVECKVARGPWLVLSTATATNMQPSLADSLGSDLARSATWVLNRRRLPMAIFEPGNRVGFGVKEVRAKSDSPTKDRAERDPPYQAIQGTVERAVLRSRRLSTHGSFAVGTAPRDCTVLRPVVVVQGSLCEAFWSESAGKLEVVDASWKRLDWSGANAGMATVDLVTVGALDGYLSELGDQKELLSGLRTVTSELVAAFEASSIEPLRLEGIDETTDAPKLLSQLFERERYNRDATQSIRRQMATRPHNSRDDSL